MARRGIRVADLLDPAALRERDRAARRAEELRAHASSTSWRAGRRRRAVDRARDRAGAAGSRPTSTTPAHARARAARGQERAVRGRAGDTSSTSTTAPIRTSPRRTASRARRARAPGIGPTRDRPRARHHQGLHHARRRRPVPDRARRATRASGCAQRGDEFGATTGRPRRCGWLDVGDAARGRDR